MYAAIVRARQTIQSVLPTVTEEEELSQQETQIRIEGLHGAGDVSVSGLDTVIDLTASPVKGVPADVMVVDLTGSPEMSAQRAPQIEKVSAAYVLSHLSTRPRARFTPTATR